MSNFPDFVQVYLVGGALRDNLLGLKVKDRDYVVVGATPELMIKKGFKPVGQDFPVFLHPKTGEEYALARTERKTGQGYHGFSVSFDPNVTLTDDLYRRDLTINAMAQNNNGDIIDPYHGQLDIQQKILRHVSDAFIEDPLRVLRLARFHAKLAPLGFRIDEQTWRMAQRMVEDGELNHLTTERIWLEITKALSSDAATVFFQDLYDLNAMNILGFSDKLPLTMFKQMQASLQSVSERSLSTEIRFAAWLELYSLGADQIAQTLPLPKQYQYWINLFINHAYTMRHWYQVSSEARWQVFKQSGSLRNTGDIVEFAQVIGLDESLISNINTCQNKLQSITPQSFIDKGLQGKALGEAIKEKQLEYLEIKDNHS